MNRLFPTQKQKRLIHKTGLACAVAASAAMFSLQAFAQSVSEMTYRNDGDQQAKLRVQWTTPSGDVCGGEPKNQNIVAPPNQSVTVDLSGLFTLDLNMSDTPYCPDRANAAGELRIEPGSRVRGLIVVAYRKFSSCLGAAPNATFSRSGGEITYVTKGASVAEYKCKLSE